MPSRSIIINLNILEDRLAHLISCHDRFVLDRLDVHRMEEALNTRIIPTVSFYTHALFKVISTYYVPIVFWAIMATSVTMDSNMLRENRAFDNASQTRATVILVSIDQPITCRE